MSFYFEKVYFPLLENMFKDTQIKQSSKKSSQKKKYSLEDSNQSGNKKSSNFNRENLPDPKFSLQRFIDLSQQSNQEIYDQRMMEQKDLFQTQNFHFNQKDYFETQEQHFVIPKEENILFKLQKPPQKYLEQKDFHTDLKQSLVSNASSYNKSQRLETIFSSARKQRTQKSKSKTYQNTNKKKHLKPNYEVINQDAIDESSRKNMRKSFCLKFVQDDEQWEDTCSKSLKSKK